MPLYATAAELINSVAREVGLAPSLDPTVSTADENMIRLTELTTSVGRWLLLEYPWTRLTSELAFTSSSSTLYAIPDDFIDIVEGTFWDRTRNLPVTPLSPKRRASLKAAANSLIISPAYAITSNQIELWPQPVAPGISYALQYRTAYWVQGFGTSAPGKDNVSVGTDLLFLPKHLLSRALKRAFLRSKGYDSEAADQDFERAIALAESGDTATAPVIDMGGQGTGDIIPGALVGGSPTGTGTGSPVFGGLFP